MNCPVCEEPSIDVTPPGKDSLVTKCANCGIFEISGTKLPLFSLMDQMNRGASLDNAKAKAVTGQIPMICHHD